MRLGQCKRISYENFGCLLVHRLPKTWMWPWNLVSIAGILLEHPNSQIVSENRHIILVLSTVFCSTTVAILPCCEAMRPHVLTCL